MAKFDIIAATGCPTGIAHTFMAKEALEKAAAERGLTIKVETHGQVGVENELTKSEIAGAKAVVVAADKDVQAERFAGTLWGINIVSSFSCCILMHFVLHRILK